MSPDRQKHESARRNTKRYPDAKLSLDGRKLVLLYDEKVEQRGFDLGTDNKT